MEMNQSTIGLRELERACQLSPQDATFHLNLAQAYQRAGKSALAAKEFAVFRRLQNEGEVSSAAPQ
jgi:Flp pilus assembly protein TadD